MYRRSAIMAEFTFAPLTPPVFLDRAQSAFATRVAVVDGERRFSYAELCDRVNRVVSAVSTAVDR